MRSRNPNRRFAGLEAKHSGDAFETWVEGQLTAAVYLGILAHYEHSEPHAKIINGRWTPVDSGVADYFGALEGGRILVAECKSVKGERMPRSVVQKKQAEQLEAVASAGGLALLVGEFRLERDRLRFAVPWLEAPWEVARSAESLTPRVVESWLLEGPECFLLRWHKGGPRSGSWNPVRKRVYPVE